LIGKYNLGISVPVAKPSTGNIHIKVMVALSSLPKHHIFQDLNDTVYLDTAVHTTHGHDFAQELHQIMCWKHYGPLLAMFFIPAVVMMMVIMTSILIFCRLITFSVFVEVDGLIYRLAIIGYSRKAICEYYEQ
jgi:predicted membrane channel-forming protein YqfA (hemolysin III family)